VLTELSCFRESEFAVRNVPKTSTKARRPRPCHLQVRNHPRNRHRHLEVARHLIIVPIQPHRRLHRLVRQIRDPQTYQAPHLILKVQAHPRHQILPSRSQLQSPPYFSLVFEVVGYRQQEKPLRVLNLLAARLRLVLVDHDQTFQAHLSLRSFRHCSMKVAIYLRRLNRLRSIVIISRARPPLICRTRIVKIRALNLPPYIQIPVLPGQPPQVDCAKNLDHPDRVHATNINPPTRNEIHLKARRKSTIPFSKHLAPLRCLKPLVLLLEEYQLN
jgi:hypothetical protein